VANGRSIRPVWQNEIGGFTFAVGDDWYVKWLPPGTEFTLADEAARLRWAAAHTPVPEVVDEGADDDGAWLVTTALPGENAVSPRWKADPARAVAAIGEGLRAMHESLPVGACPFSWSAADRLAVIQERAAAGKLRGRYPDLDATLTALAATPPPDALVVCHGDACAPNTLITEDGRWSGHVDLGELGVADRWADLAIATWSTEWNYGPGWEKPLLDAYGIDPDPQRTEYYRLLWDAGP